MLNQTVGKCRRVKRGFEKYDPQCAGVTVKRSVPLARWDRCPRWRLIVAEAGSRRPARCLRCRLHRRAQQSHTSTIALLTGRAAGSITAPASALTSQRQAELVLAEHPSVNARGVDAGRGRGLDVVA